MMEYIYRPLRPVRSNRLAWRSRAMRQHYNLAMARRCRICIKSTILSAGFSTRLNAQSFKRVLSVAPAQARRRAKCRGQLGRALLSPGACLGLASTNAGWLDMCAVRLTYKAASAPGNHFSGGTMCGNAPNSCRWDNASNTTAKLSLNSIALHEGAVLASSNDRRLQNQRETFNARLGVINKLEPARYDRTHDLPASADRKEFNIPANSNTR